MLSSSSRLSSTPPKTWKYPISASLYVAAVAFASLIPFWDSLTHMWDSWISVPEYSHCLLIPPIAGFLVWQRRVELQRLEFRGSWVGALFVLLGGGLLVSGQLGTMYTVVQYGYVITLYGLILALVGWQAFRILAAPLLIVLFMIPLPQFFLNNLSTKLQLFSSQIGVYLIRLFGISVYLEGNVIDLGGYKLEVAEACSGLRYLFPLMCLGFLVAYLYNGATWKRVFLFFSSIPITVLMNSIRIGVIGISVEYWGIEMAEGFLHEFQGWMVFMISVLVMLAELAALNGIGKEPGTWRHLLTIELPKSESRNASKDASSLRVMPLSFVLASGLLAGFLGIAFFVPRPTEIIPTREFFVQFPMTLGEWQGRRGSLDAVFTNQLKLDDYVLANYLSPGGSDVNLYISYYNSQRKGEAVHSPRSCLPGGGWQMRDFSQRTIPAIFVGGKPLQVNRALIGLANQHQLVYYWFQQRGRIITSEFGVKWYLFWDALISHRTDGAMIRLIIPLPYPSAEAEADADHRLVSLLSKFASDLPRYVPN